MKTMTISLFYKSIRSIVRSVWAGLAIALFPLIVQATPQATPGQSSASFFGDFASDKLLQDYHFDRAIVPYSEFPFPDVPKGTLWQPRKLPRMEVVTFVPDGARRWLPDWAKSVLDEADALIEAGNGQAAITLLTNANPPLPEGAAEQAIGNIYLAGKGGVLKDRQMGIGWTKRAAAHNPHLYKWIGGATNDRTERKHYLSYGLSRGCFGCAGSLMQLYETKTVGKGKRAKKIRVNDINPDLALRYALFATEIGDREGPRLLSKVISDARDAPETVSEETRAIITELKSFKEGLITAAYYQTYSGLVPGRLKVSADLLEQEEYLDAGTALLFSNARGRYMKDVVNAVMERAPTDTFHPTVATTFAMRLTEWGDLRHAAAASIIEREGYQRYMWLHNSWKKFSPPPGQKTMNARGYEARQRRAAAMLRKGNEAGMTPNGINGAISGDRAESLATECLRKAVNQPNANAYGNATRINNCRRLVDQAWAVSPATDFGLFSNDDFESLLQNISQGCPQCRAVAVQRQNDARQAEIRDRKARLKRWDDGPGGRNTPIASSQAEMMERAEARTDFILGGLDPVQTVAQGGLTTDEARTYVALDQFYAAYRNRMQQVASGQQNRSNEACQIWSYAVLPMCN